MRIACTEVYRFSLPFAIPVRIGGTVLTDREGLLIALTDDQGRCSYGEIAPLPGLDSTTLDRCLQDIPAVGDALNNADLSYDRFSISAPLLGVAAVPVSSWTGHTLFGVESALLGLYLQHEDLRGRTAVFPLPDGLLRIPVNALFIPEAVADTLERQIQNLKSGGATTFKIKIGRLPAEEEIRQILHLVERLGTEISLRLDGNRNLSPALYRHYYEALRDLPVEYVEEPLPEEELGKAGEIPWPLALDESLQRLLDPENPSFAGLAPAVRTVILKPGLLRGLHAMARAVRDAEKVGIRTIFSSAFNSGISLATLGVFSHLLSLPPGQAHGLDTLRYLAADVLQPSPEISGGMLEIPAGLLFGEASLNEDCIRDKIL
jgi:o-succinylbenzoate synthase